MERDEPFEVALALLGNSCSQWEHALGYLIQKSDGNNRQKLKAAFPDVWAQFLKMGKVLHQKYTSLPEVELINHARYNCYHPDISESADDDEEGEE